MRNFDTGATRDTDEGKYDFEGFLSPSVIEEYAAYMHENRVQADGKLRASDNWQKGIPQDAYMKSMWRHFFAAWKGHRANEPIRADLCGVLFNAMGYMHEELRKRKEYVDKIGSWEQRADVRTREAEAAQKIENFINEAVRLETYPGDEGRASRSFVVDPQCNCIDCQRARQGI